MDAKWALRERITFCSAPTDASKVVCNGGARMQLGSAAVAAPPDPDAPERFWLRESRVTKTFGSGTWRPRESNTASGNTHMCLCLPQ